MEVRSSVVLGRAGWACSGRDGLSCILGEADLLLEAHPQRGAGTSWPTCAPDRVQHVPVLTAGTSASPEPPSRGDLGVTGIQRAPTLELGTERPRGTPPNPSGTRSPQPAVSSVFVGAVDPLTSPPHSPLPGSPRSTLVLVCLARPLSGVTELVWGGLLGPAAPH